jgi:hypothetical protein
VGKYSASEGKKFYYLEENLYSETLLQNNTLVLFDSSVDESYLLRWQKDISGSYAGEDVRITYLASGSADLIFKFKGNSLGSYLAQAGGSNTKHFFLFALGTSITETVAQNTINFAKHAHNGIDSERINHKDLINAESNLQGFYQDQDGSDHYGLDFVNYSRQLAYSESKDNVHPQYLNRLGYMYGGSHGFYHDIKGGNANKLLDLNLFHGDFIFYPIDSLTMGPRSFKYADLTEYDAADTQETIEWDLELPVGMYVSSAVEDYFVDSRSHANIYGYPLRNGTNININSSTKLYYEPYNFIADSGIDNRGESYSFSRHGFIPGDKTTGGDVTNPFRNEENIRRGLNINWGNLFFGHREDIYNGLLTASSPTARQAASAFWRVGEFNVLTTSNGKSGLNTNSSLKSGYAWRDGFSVRGTQGSNIWLSAGAETEDPTVNSKNDNGRASTIALEVSGAAWYDALADGRGGLKTVAGEGKKASGAGLFMSPSLDTDNKIPWAYKPPAGPGPSVAYTIGQMWNNSAIDVTEGTNGSVIDLFSVAEDYNTTDSPLDIPLGSDQALFQWIYGRPFIRGTYGINFCLEGSFEEAIPGFPNGFDKKTNLMGPFDWGVNNVGLSEGLKEYVHREFRFWGKQNQLNEDASSDARGNTKGGNVNLLYNFGRDYQRFGKDLPWDNFSTSGKSKTSSIWSNARITAVGSSTPETYGSAIRQASYVEAFEGFRNDPSQPFVSEYIFPFRVRLDINQISMPDEYAFPLTYIHDQSIVLVDNPDTIATTAYDLESGGSGLGNGIKIQGFEQETLDNATQSFQNPFGATSPRITFDGIIRGAEELFLKNSGLNRHTKIFPRGLVDISLSLENYIGYTYDGVINATGSPHENSFGDFGNIKGGKGIMLSAKKAIVESTGQSSHPPIIRSSNSSNFGIGGLNVGSYGSPYSSALTCLKRAVGGGEAVNHIMRFPLFNEQYPDFSLDQMFAFLIALEGSTAIASRAASYNGATSDANISLPYRVFPISLISGAELPYGTVITGTNQYALCVEFNGYITIKYVTTASMYYNGLDNVPD